MAGVKVGESLDRSLARSWQSGNSLIRQWRDGEEWTLGTCAACGTEGKDVKALIELLREARAEIANWYDESTGKPAEDLEVVRKIDEALK